MMNSQTQTTGSAALCNTSLSTAADVTTEATTDGTTEGCRCLSAANKKVSSPSLLLGVSSIACVSRLLNLRRNPAYGGVALRHLLHVLSCVIVLSIAGQLAIGCGDTPKPAETASKPASAAEPAKPAIPEDIQAGAQALLGTETTVLVYGDLAKNGKQQFLAANVVPKTTKNNNIPGTIITRAVIAQNDDGQWKEIFRCDEHLKNAKGFLGLTPLSDVSGWRIAYEQDPAKGLSLYLTPLKGVDDPAHSLPIGVRWNPQTKRYQSLDRTYEHFLLEQPTMGGTPKSVLH
jgi:hypothetical protein